MLTSLSTNFKTKIPNKWQLPVIKMRTITKTTTRTGRRTLRMTAIKTNHQEKHTVTISSNPTHQTIKQMVLRSNSLRKTFTRPCC